MLMNHCRLILLLSAMSSFAYGCQKERSSFLPNLEEVREILRADSNVYDSEPTVSTASLDEKHVMNAYWCRIKETRDPKIINEAFKKILSLSFTDEGYPLQRYHIAAAVLAGANPHVRDFLGFPLEGAAMRQDEDLCKVLLKHGAKPNEWKESLPPFFRCRSEKMVRLFLAHGADLKAKGQFGNTYLHHLMWNHHHEISLIPLALAAGLSPFDLGLLNGTPLHCLAFAATDHTKEDLEKKLAALLKGLNTAEIKRLVYMRQSNQGTVLQILNASSKHYQYTMKHLSERCDFLKDKLQSMTADSDWF